MSISVLIAPNNLPPRVWRAAAYGLFAGHRSGAELLTAYPRELIRAG
ncbi:hypothetical protein [Desulfofundulus sp. TPOSR]|nr:hypothetical protein [Desulfofundulus sp. TPOSR]